MLLFAENVVTRRKITLSDFRFYVAFSFCIIISIIIMNTTNFPLISCPILIRLYIHEIDDIA